MQNLNIKNLFVILVCFISIQLEAQVNFGPLYDQIEFDGYAPDQSLTPGATMGTATASNGSLMYTIPIQVPPGTNGFMPGISLNYSSHGGNGLVGHGWSIAGLSVITRGTKTILHDGAVKPVNLVDDAFYIDGARLIEKTPNVYVKEMHDFSKIEAIGTYGGAPEWFRVTLKDGTVMRYGKDHNSAFKTHDNSEILSWRLDRILSLEGNYIDFIYSDGSATGDRDHRITEIIYTGNVNTGLAPYNSINFNYEDRGDFSLSMFEAGSELKLLHLLDNIEIKTEGNALVKRYELAYGSDDINVFLTKITEFGSDGISAFNPTIFKYGDDIPEFEYELMGNYLLSDWNFLSGDYNADGYSDLLSVHLNMDEDVAFNDMFSVSTKLPNQNIQDFEFKFNEGLSNQYGQLGNEVNQNNYISADFTGEGRDDIMYLFSQKISDSNARIATGVSLHEMHENADGVTEIDIPLDPNLNPYYSPFEKPLTVGDFNADGIMDAILILANEFDYFYGLEDYRAFIYYGNISSSFEELSISGNHDIPIGNWATDEVNTIDIDGDGKQELMISNYFDSEIYSIDGLTITSVNGGSNDFPTNTHLLYFGDFNGDRKTDVLSRNNELSWEISYSDGNTFDGSTEDFNWPPIAIPEIDENYNGSLLLIGDYNGDGRSDIAHGHNFIGGQNIYMHFNTGSEWINHMIFVPEPADNYRFGVQDFNGDGKSEIMNISTGFVGPIHLLKFKPEGEELLLKAVKNGFGTELELNYSRMTEVSNYFKTEETEHPINTIQLPINLIQSIEHEGLAPETFIYNNAKLHKEGRGLLGFEVIKKFESNFMTETIYEFDEIQNVFLTHQVNQYNGGLVKTSDLDFTLHVMDDAIDGIEYYVNNLSSTSESNFFTNSNRYQGTSYDLFGNIIYTEETIGSETTFTDIVYADFGGVSRPVTIITNKSRFGSPTFTTHIEKTYNDLGQVTSQITNPTDALSNTVSFQYNDFGNLTSSTLSASGLPSRTESHQFDSKGRYAIQKTNALNQTESFVIDPKWGSPISHSKIDETTTYFQFDMWGRKKKTILPLGNPIEEVYGWSPGCSYTHGVLHPGSPDVTNFFDEQLRVIKTETEGFNQTQITEQSYDEVGNVEFKTSASGLLTIINYDDYYRPITIATDHEASLEVTYIDYNYSGNGNLTTTTTNELGITTQVKDKSGKIISSTDEGGTLHYTYHSNGKVKSVTQNGVVLTSTQFDSFGRQTELNDINAGTTVYEYDAFGQLVLERSPSLNNTTFTYNDLGMMLSRDGSEGNTTYQYHQHGGDINRPLLVTGFDGGTEKYIYDNFGRLTEFTHTIDGSPFLFTYEYDDYDRVTSKVFPSGFELKYEYDLNGFMKKITDASGSQTIYENLQMSPLNKQKTYKSVINGNTETINIDYHHSFPINISNGTKNSINYDWDYATSNLLSRTTNYLGVASYTENFTYDNLNRLTLQEVVGGQSYGVSFADNGNILSKDDAGSNYGYDPNKINAVNCIGNPDYSNLSIYNQDIEYTSFYQPAMITENDFTLEFSYNSGQERQKSTLSLQDGSTQNRLYLGDYEMFNSTHLHYVNIGRGVHMVIERNGSTDTYYRTMTDYLGSILFIGNSSGNEFQFNYDAWGRNRDINSLSFIEGSPDRPDWFNRGYTGHEHLYEFQLINMNGRMYDPVIGRMLSPDNNIQLANFSQNYNRYSYALNNPLKFTDPDGEFLFEVFVGLAINAGINTLFSNKPVFEGWAGAAFGGFMTNGIGSTIMGSIGSHLPSFDIELGNFSLSLSPALAFGSGGVGLGLNAGFNVKIGQFSYGRNYGFTFYSQYGAINTKGGTHDSGYEKRIGWGAKWENDDLIFAVGGTKFHGLYPQKTGYITAGTQDINYTFDNDVKKIGPSWLSVPLGDNGDRFRSAGNVLKLGEYEVGLLMFTGDPGLDGESRFKPPYEGSKHGGYSTNEAGDNPDSHRLGALYVAKGQYRIGYNSEAIRHTVQNRLIHTLSGSAYFRVLNLPSSVYGGLYNKNAFTTW